MSPLRFFFLLIALAGVLSAQTGVVRSGAIPIPGASVTATQGDQKITAITDENGRYEFKNLGSGIWDFAVESFGFAPAHKLIQIDPTAPAAMWALEVKAPQREAAPVSRQQAPAGRRGPGPGFQSVTLNGNSTDAQMAAAEAATQVDAAASPVASGDSNEAFLVTGSLSQGLGQARPDAEPGLNAGFGGPNPFGGLGLNGGTNGDGPNPANAGGLGGPGGGRGGGGFGGGPGGGGGGFGGGRGGGGGGGFGGGGAGGRAGARRGPPNGGAFGNRARRGRDGIRGQAFATVGNSAVNARPYSVNGEDILQPAYGSVRWGLNLGGALDLPHLIHDRKTFFFVNYTGTRTRAPYSATTTLPTLAERAGDFSAVTTSFGPVQVYDPTTHQPFAGNVIPSSRLDPTAVRLLNYIPLPNLPGLLNNNYQIRLSTPSNTQNLQVRVNRPLTTKDQLDVNVSFQNRDGLTAQTFGYADAATGSGLSSGVGWTHTISRTFLNRVSWSFSRNRNYTLPYFAFGENVAAIVGINGTSGDPINYGPPNLSFTNFGGLTDASPALTRNQTSGINDVVTLIRGRHNLSIGGDFRRQQLNLLTDQNGRGTYTFSGLLTSAFDANGQPVKNTGYDLADYLLGLPQSSSVRFGTNSNYFRASVYDAFLTDDFRFRSNLTLNIGLRWEYFAPYTEKYNRMVNLDLSPDYKTATQVLAGQTGPYGGQYPDSLIKPHRDNFSPRLGIAWKPWPRKQTLVRIGYSIFYNGSVYAQFASKLASQPPFAKSASLVTSVTNPITIENGFASVPSNTITNTYAINPNYLMPYVQTWSVNVQQTLPHQFVVELGYLGTKGTRLDIQGQPNTSTTGSYVSGDNALQTRNTTPFTYETSTGNSIYHALQARFTRRFARGVSWNASYVFSKSIDDASSIGGGGATVAQNFFNLSAERGLSSFNRTHVLNTSVIFTSPFGETGVFRLGGWRENLLKDWQLSGSVSTSSGLPFTARVLGNQTNTAGSGVVGSGRADATGQPLYGNGGLIFNPAAFTIPNSNTFGNAGRNTIIGPSTLTLNLSFTRSFRLKSDRRRAEFRVDAANLTNSVNITSFNTTVNATNYGLPLGASGMRTVTATVRLRF